MYICIYIHIHIYEESKRILKYDMIKIINVFFVIYIDR